MFRTLMVCMTLGAGLASCSRNLDENIDMFRGIIKVDDNGTIEKGVMYLWEMLTGHELGLSLKDLAESKNTPIEITIVLFQNYVYGAMQRGATAEQAIENFLFLAGFDEKLDGKIQISKEIKSEIKKRLEKSKKKKKEFLEMIK